MTQNKLWWLGIALLFFMAVIIYQNRPHTYRAVATVAGKEFIYQRGMSFSDCQRDWAANNPVMDCVAESR